MYEYPVIPITTKQIWTIKSSIQLETPRYVILTFQTDIKNKPNTDSSKFNHCNITDVKLYLNSEHYPYDSKLNINFSNNQYTLLYEMYMHFQKSYYNKNCSLLLNWEEFTTTAPFIVIDYSKQNEKLKSATVDIRLEFEASENFPTLTTAYCFILHDKVVEYTPLNESVNIKLSL